ncbi:MAG: radical SAM protein [Gemmataceae bacterium]
MVIPLPLVDISAPEVALSHLDSLWFQVGGTLCNLTCHHCFISCTPHNHTFEFLDVATVKRYLDESVHLGVKEYYFTGGEPFLNRDMVPILELTLRYGPATVLTNGTVFQDEWLERLRVAEEASSYSLEFRVSIDGFTAEQNDPIRGEGTFERAMGGVRQLVRFGFLPIITATLTDDSQEAMELVRGFFEVLKANGYDRPRLKVMPTLRIGAEQQRRRGYHDEERITAEMMEHYDASNLVCHNSRIVTNRGVAVCPILVEAPDAHFGTTLREALKPFALRHNACYTCYQYGAICSNVSSYPEEFKNL